MTDAERLAFVTRVLQIYGEADLHELLFWRVDIPDHPGLALFARCNDLFWWATADVEEITPSNLAVLDQTATDLAALDLVTPDREEGHAEKADYPMLYLSELFAARVRRLRPQRPCYRTMSPAIAALFDACGPERDPASEG